LPALVAANVYVFAFGMSWGPVVWVRLGEMFNNRIRATALADAGLSFAYGLYTVFATLALLFVLREVRETKGRQLEEM
jgi:hypothetical protein